MLKTLKPRRIVVYGSRKSTVFTQAEENGVEILHFDTDTAKFFLRKRV